MTSPLREVGEGRQREGEPPRRWYTCAEADLTVWFEPDDTPCRFQFCWEKGHDEHVVSWDTRHGLWTGKVDDGDLAEPYKASPLLIQKSGVDLGAAATTFEHLSAGVDATVRDFVLQRLSGS